MKNHSKIVTQENLGSQTPKGSLPESVAKPPLGGWGSMTYQECLDWLFTQLPMYQRVGGAAYKADLSNTHKLMDLLDHPENKFKSVHVAGTNGKGSTSHMLAAIFQKAGYKTGLYTSPHLKDFRERIRINGEMIPEKDVASFVANHKAKFESIGLSFFEMTVGMAFQYFADEKVDIAIVEVGMGGRLDSTNVVTPELSIITNISLDHTQFLGNDLASIAGEKGGIIKKNTPVVIGEHHPETDPVFTKLAEAKNAPLSFAEDLIPIRELDELDLKGIYQKKNIRTVLAAVQKLEEKGYPLENTLKEALLNASKLTGLRGRWETLSTSPRIICDTGHNEAGVKLIVEQLAKEPFENLYIVWGMVGDKDITSVLKLLPKDATYYWCKPSIPRGKDAEELKQEAMVIGLQGEVYNSPSSALEACKNAAFANDLIFVGGSTFVVADVL